MSKSFFLSNFYFTLTDFVRLSGKNNFQSESVDNFEVAFTTLSLSLFHFKTFSKMETYAKGQNKFIHTRQATMHFPQVRTCFLAIDRLFNRSYKIWLEAQNKRYWREKDFINESYLKSYLADGLYGPIDSIFIHTAQEATVHFPSNLVFQPGTCFFLATIFPSEVTKFY